MRSGLPWGGEGIGVVWRAQDAVLGREVAVKDVVFPPPSSPCWSRLG